MGLELINEIKKKKGMTSKQLSEKSGVPIGTLNKILNGQTKNPAYETIFAIANALDCSVDVFREKDELSNDNSIADITEDENNLISKYRKLDSKGQHTVNTVLSVEYSRCTGEHITFAAHDDGLDPDKAKERIEKAKEIFKQMDEEK
ncbi:helix-turn-helix domain-containing protein [Clostridium intestinale]|uniref:Helix-turn-helix n=1 Tax=Clostridium intestinale DSM 6191 TaxID=1121320 RepID=A0A1M5U4Q2_9CLOT|nr:helix-turn-helix transcriptional regulator [Clostridium intestinale]SHH57663.1 Helix-turn-helix [Clostridium intestinale DSM 6191]